MTSKIKIYIPSKSRAGSNFLLNLKKEKMNYYIFVNLDQLESYVKYHPRSRLIIVPDKITGIAKTRQYIFDYARNVNDKKFFMSDDDLYNFFIKEPKNNQLDQISFKDFISKSLKEIKKIEKKDPKCVQIGFKKSTFAIPSSPYTLYTDLGDIYYFNLERIPKNIRYDTKMIALEDTDLILQFYKHGLTNYKLNHFIFTSPKSGTYPGGLHSQYLKGAKQKGILGFQKKYPNMIKISDLEKGKYRILWNKLKK